MEIVMFWHPDRLPVFKLHFKYTFKMLKDSDKI
jgi:hypothetical protein